VCALGRLSECFYVRHLRSSCSLNGQVVDGNSENESPVEPLGPGGDTRRRNAIGPCDCRSFGGFADRPVAWIRRNPPCINGTRSVRRPTFNSRSVKQCLYHAEGEAAGSTLSNTKLHQRAAATWRRTCGSKSPEALLREGDIRTNRLEFPSMNPKRTISGTILKEGMRSEKRIRGTVHQVEICLPR